VITRFTAILLTGLALFVSSQAFAVDPTVSDVQGELEAYAIGIEAEREQAIRDNLNLTDAQGDIFWPLYQEYRVAIGNVTDREIRIITDYVELHRSGNISDEEAKILLEAALDTDAEDHQIRQEYMTRFLDRLPAKTVVRFYQLENRLDVLARSAVMREIPLMEASADR
jgi:hypothetical protein